MAGTSRTSTRWRPGDAVLWRFLQRGRLFGARPLRVVEDAVDVSALWLGPGTTIARARPHVAEPGASDLRSLGLPGMFTTDWVPTPGRWRGSGILKLVPWGAAHSIWLFWHEDGSFRGWYVNLERPHTRHGTLVETSDWTLDIWVEPDRTWQWKDEHELPVAVESGFLTAGEAEAARREGERVVEAIERWDGPFAAGWERWRPDPRWEPLELPPRWDAPAPEAIRT